MIRNIRCIDDIARYQYRVIILANARGITRQKLGFLIGGLPTELFDHTACYTRLQFPLVSGSFFNAEQLHLSLNLSDKNAGSKISYTVFTEHAKCEVTMVFVPTLEVAKAMYRYRNAILKHNPRSYLELEGQNVNKAIRNSIEQLETNEFPIFNNGITILSNETYLNERIGQKDRAQLTLTNPQIFKEHMNDTLERVFGEKEVLMKIITFDTARGTSEPHKLRLIEAISRATNSQTTVTHADRRSNEPEIREIQRKCFDRLGIFLERKLGEFADGVREGYLGSVDVVERNIFFRADLVSEKRLPEAGSKRTMARVDFRTILDVPGDNVGKYGVALTILQRIHDGNSRGGNYPSKLSVFTATQAWVGLCLALERDVDSLSAKDELIAIADEVRSRWQGFTSLYQERHKDSQFAHIDTRG